MQFFFYFIKQIYKQWFLIFVVIIGLTSGLLTIFPIQKKFWLINLIIFTICFITSIITTLILYQIQHIPVDATWMFEKPKEKPIIKFPYQKEYLKVCNQLARSHYGKNSINQNIVKKWYEKNPFLLTILTDSHNRFAGYFDILPLESNFGKKLVKGTVKENNIRGKNILSPSQMKNTKYIYIAGVSVKDDTPTCKKHGAILIYSILIYLECFYDFTKPHKIYAIAATQCGKKVLEKLKFQIETEKTNRKDKLNLYSIIITKHEINYYKKLYAFCGNMFDFSAYQKTLTLYSKSQ